MGVFLNKNIHKHRVKRTRKKKGEQKKQLNCLSFGEEKQFEIKVSSTNKRGSW